MYICKCGKTFETAQKFAGHTTWCIEYFKFKFPELTDDEIYSKMHSRNYEVVDKYCPYCNEHFTSKLSYSSHTRVCKLNTNRKLCVCCICGNEFSPANIKRHESSCTNNKHKKIVYSLDHDDLFCKFCSKECKNKNSLVQHEIRCKNNPNRRVHSLGGFKKGMQSWNKGLTKETDERVAKRAKTFKQNYEKGLIKFQGRKHTEEMKKHLSEIAKDRGFGGNTGKHSIIYRGIRLDSSYELQVAKELDKNNILWIRPKRIKYYEYNDKNANWHWYTPDFYLPEYNVYLDPKNDFLINNVNPALGYKDIDKIRWVEEFNSIKIIILSKDELTWDKIKEKIIMLP